MYQRTVKNSVTVHGIGLHSGMPVEVRIKPARPNFGIAFVRTDLADSPKIPAHSKYVTQTQLATTLGLSEKVYVSTVEHLMAAIQGLGIDNALIEVSGTEIPILDGSAMPFYQAILQAGGVQPQVQGKVILALRRRVELKIGDKVAIAEPSSRLEVHGSIEWDHPAIGYQEYHYVEGKTEFTELASARTFCLLRDVEMMKRAGLIKGGSLENAVVMDEAKVLNPEGLRYSDELVRHKVLDALGDFKLMGVPIQAYIRLHRAGHDMHNLLLRAILKDEANYELIDSVESEARPARVRQAMARVAAIG